jgi:hypothetical protein
MSVLMHNCQESWNWLFNYAEPPGTTILGSGPFFNNQLTWRVKQCELKGTLYNTNLFETANNYNYMEH